LTSALVGEWSASRPDRFTPGEKAPGNHWIGGWVDSRAGLDYLKKRKFLTLPGLELQPLGRPARSQSLYRLRYPGRMHIQDDLDVKCFITISPARFIVLTKFAIFCILREFGPDDPPISLRSIVTLFFQTDLIPRMDSYLSVRFINFVCSQC
jgi:hypothetical protein